MNLTDINEIKTLLARHGFNFSRSMGQNFLTAAWVPERIAEEASLGADVGVTEVGPGIGCLTEQLALRAEKVLALELDETLRGVLGETLAGKENVEIVFGDVLKTDVASLVREKQPGLRHVLCANLPYNITTPVLTALIEAKCFEKLTVMIQREAAQRLCAAPGDEDYNAFSVFVQWFTEPKVLFDVSPDCFIPQPKVTSSVLSLTPRKEPLVPVSDEKLLLRTVRAAFAQRRKTLVNALQSGFGGLSKGAAGEILESIGLDVRVRGEALDVRQFALLSNALAAYFNSGK